MRGICGRDLELEPDERRLSRQGRIIPLTPKAAEMLVLLVKEAGRIVTKEWISDAP